MAERIDFVQHIRTRPGMYGIGGNWAANHLLDELARTRVLATRGRATGVWLKLADGDGVYQVVVNGECDATEQLPLRDLPAGAIDDADSSMLITSAASEWLEVDIAQRGSRWRQRFERGYPVGPASW